MKLFIAMAALLAISGCCGKKSETTMNEKAIENIMTRASVRSFTDQIVEEEKIEILLRAAMAAPTAMNKQPWHFVVVTDTSKLSEIAQYPSPLAIVVCGDINKTLPGHGKEFWITDASLASQNILLAAHAVGLGGVWTAVFPNPDRTQKVREALGLPENLLPLNTLIIGYPTETPQPKDKWKPENITRIEM